MWSTALPACWTMYCVCSEGGGAHDVQEAVPIVHPIKAVCLLFGQMSGDRGPFRNASALHMVY